MWCILIVIKTADKIIILYYINDLSFICLLGGWLA